MMRAAVMAALLVMGAVPGGARAAEPAPVFKDLIGCRSIADPAARLACYDAKAEVAEVAQRSGDIVVADKVQVRQAKKALFGFGTIRIPFFGDKGDDMPTEIQARITALRDLGYGRWEFTLDNGMRWRQTDDEQIYPRIGQDVTVKTAAMSSYFLKIKTRAVRVMRIQ